VQSAVDSALKQIQSETSEALADIHAATSLSLQKIQNQTVDKDNNNEQVQGGNKQPITSPLLIIERNATTTTQFPVINVTLPNITRSTQNITVTRLTESCLSTGHAMNISQQPVGVFILPEVFNETCEFHHYLLDGVNHSPCLYREMDPAKAHVWVYDRHRGNCNLESFFQNEVERRKNISNHTLNRWKVFFLDFYDGPHLRPCTNLIQKIQNSVHDVIHLKRSIVVERQGLNRTGRKQDFGNQHKVIHIPYGVRSDLVYSIHQVIQNMNTSLVNTLPTDKIIFSPVCPVDLPGRLGGVRYFWHHPSKKCIPPNPHFECVNGRLRDLVSDTLFLMEANISSALNSSSARSIHGEMVNASNALTISLSGGGLFQGGLGRQKSSLPYAIDLLTYRIIVVAQRDLHEDHYRLMEAFAGGALVFTDLMLAPPKRLVDGEHYVVYRSMQELQQKILYYLTHEVERRKVALAGWNLVMRYYRSWHMMESVLLREEEP
jgi:hypothetical protein